MGILSRRGVSFAPGAKGDDQDELEAAASSSADSGLELEAPATPPGGEGAAAAAAAPKYWPGEAEVAAVLALLEGEDRAECDAAMAHRYLRATGGDQRHAARRVHDTLAWRRAERPQDIVCTACRADRKSHYMQVVGHDLIGRPLIYSCMALATNRDVEDNRKHMISTFEQAIRLMPSQPGPSGRPVESWCWVMDFHGFSVRDCDPRLAKIFLTLSAAHYPERLGTFFIVSAPAVFNTLWRAISRFIDPVTKEKIHFVNFSPKKDNATLEALLARYFDADTRAWLLREMGDNRDKGLALSKAYSYPDLSKLAAGGRGAPDVAAAQEARRAQSSCQRHDHLGSPAFLESLEGNPDLLLPHLQQLSLA